MSDLKGTGKLPQQLPQNVSNKNHLPSKEDEGKDTKRLQYFRTWIGSSTLLSKKDKNEPARFLGDGVSFKAKLIGILEVSEARGDRMCQEALADLKMAIRAAGEHKQRININIAIDGLRLRDEKTGDCLYHHPVHKISFIAQDMSDSRAFGYIFGSPDTGHRFFGIKTDKAASQVVITMRDLFQVVFELKKKEIEMAKQHIEHHQIKYSSPLFSDSTNKSSIDSLKIRPIAEDRIKESTSSADREGNQEHIMDLLDLELELNNIQQGINQMDRITPSDPFGPAIASKPSVDPFGDSFNPLSAKAKIPPPPETTSKRAKPGDKHWFDHETEALFEETDLPNHVASIQSGSQAGYPLQTISASPLPSDANLDDSFPKKMESSPPRDQFDVFTDLDPLGTGRSKPYVDKKDFFQDLKNPPKKVLRDLVTEVPAENKQLLHFQGSADSDKAVSVQQGAKSDHPNGGSSSTLSSQLFSDAFQDDPFDKDPFSEVDFSQSIFTPSGSGDPFERFADFNSFRSSASSSKVESSRQVEEAKATPLKVSLPPEKLNSYESNSTFSPSLARKNRLQKANSTSCVIKPPSPKQKHRNKMFNQTSSDFGDRKSPPIMEGVTLKSKTTSLFSDKPFPDLMAPEPPPRTALNALTMKPPPLPPKRLPAAMSSKPPPRPPHSDYDYIENYQSTTYSDINSPPLPAPARKPKNGGTKSTGDSGYYLQPFPLLPPPKKKNTPSKTPPGSSTGSAESSLPPKPSTGATNKSLDITLSQLTKTGFSDLAAMLNMSPASLSKMTLQDLTKCLASLSNETQHKEAAVVSTATRQSDILKSECYSALRESIDEDTTTFKAEFEAHFSSNKEFEKKGESLFDKYAVFRELLEEENKSGDTTASTSNDSPAPLAAEEGEDDEEEVQVKRPAADVTETEKVLPLIEDRYAALRDICLDEVIEEKYEDLSDKDDSIIEPSRLEEDTDLLPQSRPPSESTESPTITMKEHQSIMEATILEEDISTLDVDEEEVPEESLDETLKETPMIQSETADPPSEASNSSINRVNDESSDKFKSHKESKTEPERSSPSSWAKFDSNVPAAENVSSTGQNEGRISPWSTESKDNDLSPACRDKRKHRKMRRPKPNQWQDDDESEEGWDGRPRELTTWSPSWRENGWSDGDSLYDEAPAYMEREYASPRRGRRRRVSPWNSRDQSPWEEDDHDLSEDQWENPRWQEEMRQRPKHRGQSWEDERRRHYDEPRKVPRKPMSWSNEIDRKSSRESLTWEDEEWHQKRNYNMERRRRKWEEDSHNRNRGRRDRDWGEQGMKMNNRYYKERGHDSHWESEYGDHGDDDGGTRWVQRARSCDRGRRQFSSHHPSEGDFQDRRYLRSREGHCSDVDYRRKAQTLQSQKQWRKHSQTSPFEDDFSSQFGFQKDSPVESDSMQQPPTYNTHKKQSFSDSSHPKEYSSYPGQGHGSGGPESGRESGKNSRSYQQSPFEDDFTNVETRRCSGRSASSDLSDPRGSTNDVFLPSGGSTSEISKPATRSESMKSQRSLKQANNQMSKSCKNINTCDVKPTQAQGKAAEPAETEVKNNLSEMRTRASNFHRSDSSSSLKKSESVNIFARNINPFDDDFFCEDSSATPGHNHREKGLKSGGNDCKWAESFDAFSLDGENK